MYLNMSPDDCRLFPVNLAELDEALIVLLALIFGSSDWINGYKTIHIKLQGSIGLLILHCEARKESLYFWLPWRMEYGLDEVGTLIV